MTNDKNLCEAIRISSGGVGSPLSEDVLTEVRLGRDNYPEKTAPYDENKLIDGAKVFLKIIRLSRSSADALEQRRLAYLRKSYRTNFKRAQSSMGLQVYLVKTGFERSLSKCRTYS